MKKLYLPFLVLSAILLISDVTLKLFDPQTKKALFWAYFIISFILIGYKKSSK